ncbi:hypothetical protein KC19_6G165200 [Ceratodon purpureus]|uniref:Uncharacterized protein n=1 Tax=Ceratodon purpureus TaxID=3225 RepID=A0A8T0HIG9_CERPU|nr:hypothetical protein KC19_6G165200 [Ceratodon purpureus]
MPWSSSGPELPLNVTVTNFLSSLPLAGDRSNTRSLTRSDSEEWRFWAAPDDRHTPHEFFLSPFIPCSVAYHSANSSYRVDTVGTSNSPLSSST